MFKKFIASAAILVAMSTASFAADAVQVEFTQADGTVSVVSFMADGTFTSTTGGTGTYSNDLATNTLCITPAGQSQLCGVAEKPVTKAGDTTTLTGDSGTVTAKLLTDIPQQ